MRAGTQLKHVLISQQHDTMLRVLAADPRLCEDVCRIIVSFVYKCTCVRCGAATEALGVNRTCFVRGNRLCFACYHRAAWPRR